MWRWAVLSGFPLFVPLPLRGREKGRKENWPGREGKLTCRRGAALSSGCPFFSLPLAGPLRQKKEKEAFGRKGGKGNGGTGIVGAGVPWSPPCGQRKEGGGGVDRGGGLGCRLRVLELCPLP